MDILATSFGPAQTVIELDRLKRAGAILGDLTGRLNSMRHPGDRMSLEAMNMLGWIYFQTSDLLEADTCSRTQWTK